MTNSNTFDMYGRGVNKYILFGQEFKAHAHAIYAQMRREDPVYSHYEGGQIKWFITRYNDVVAVLQDHKRFIKNYRRLLGDDVLPQETEQAITPQNIHAKFFSRNLLKQDEPQHSRLRALVNKAFAPRIVANMQAPIRAIANALLDRVVANGRMDLVTEYAFPLSVAVIADILGVSPDDQALFRDATEALLSFYETEEELLRGQRMLITFKEYLDRVFAERRQHPRDDLLSHLVNTQEAGDQLSEIELYSILAELISAGHETTVHLIGNGILALLQHPDQLAKLRARPELIDQAVEEILRYDCPVDRSTPRFAIEDIVFGGKTIRRGEQVLVVISSANRDIEQLSNPDVFDIERPPSRHLAFGQGIHYCLGAALSRLEGRIAIETLVQRLPGLRLDCSVDQLEWFTITLVRGLKHLPVAWDVRYPAQSTAARA